jgi:hypothetical protein
LSIAIKVQFIPFRLPSDRFDDQVGRVADVVDGLRQGFADFVGRVPALGKAFRDVVAGLFLFLEDLLELCLQVLQPVEDALQRLTSDSIHL